MKVAKIKHNPEFRDGYMDVWLKTTTMKSYDMVMHLTYDSMDIRNKVTNIKTN